MVILKIFSVAWYVSTISFYMHLRMSVFAEYIIDILS